MELMLYTGPASRGLVCEWLLEELGVPYTRVIVDLEGKEHKSAAYLKIHPLGSVPALVVDGVPMMETLAIRLFLAEQDIHKKLAPVPNGTERSVWLQWMIYPVVTLEPALVSAFMRGFKMPASERKNAATPDEQRRFLELLEPLAIPMARGCIQREGFGSADIGLCCRLLWASEVGLIPSDHPSMDYLRNHMSRESYRRVAGFN
jgi:glutathione S-transferase